MVRFAFLALTALLLFSLGCQMSSTYNADGVRNFQNGQHQQALENFERAVSMNPNDADAYYNMAATLHDWGRRSNNAQMMQQAESMYHRCLDLSPNHVDCYRGLAVLLVDSGRKDSAFTLLERWAVRSPELSAPRVELARLNEEFGQDETARQYLTQALDVDPTDSRAWAALARQREREGQTAQALTNYQHAFNLNRYHPGVSQRIAQLQQSYGGYGASVPRPPAGGSTQLSQTPSQWVPR